jgi:hypothetical protein
MQFPSTNQFSFPYYGLALPSPVNDLRQEWLSVTQRNKNNIPAGMLKMG